MGIAAIVGALVGGAVAAGVASADSAANNNGATSSSDGTGSVTTANVVRTNLTTTVQVGGSIGYYGSYTIAAPSGSSAQQVTQAQQAVTLDWQTLSADEQAESDGATADNQTISSAQSSVDIDRSTLVSDQAGEAKDCAGRDASTPACSQDAKKVSEDEAQLCQAGQQLTIAQSTATRDRDQNGAKVQSDGTKLSGDEALLSSLRATAVNPGTTYTFLPQVGDVIKEDRPVYALSNEPVSLLYGSIAAYRSFFVGMSDGSDVGELIHDMIVLGYGDGLTQGDHYSATTASAVEHWQAALGLPGTGEILLGEVVFEPSPIRVTSVSQSVGASIANGGGNGGGGGTVLTATGTTPIVTVDLDVSQEYLVKPGDAVSIVLPDGTTTVGGHIESVGNVATCPGGSGTGAGAGSSSADQSPCESGGSGTDSGPTVTVTVTLDSTPPLATLDQAPVDVDVTTQRVDHVLAVPVYALLALASGGFGVEVVTGSTTHLVGVSTGLYSNTLVQVSGSGITDGTRVEVPSS